MGGGASKTSEIVKAEDFNQSSLTDDSFSVIHLHAPSGVGEATVVLLVLVLARRVVTSLEIMKNPA